MNNNESEFKGMVEISCNCRYNNFNRFMCFFWYTNFYNRPILVYEIFPSYPIGNDEQVTMIKIANIGHSVASNVLIKCEISGSIISLDYKSPEILKYHEDDSVMYIDIDRIVQGVEIMMYIRTYSFEEEPVKDISITSDQRMGKDRKEVEKYSNLIDIIGDILLIITAIMGTIMGYLYIRYYERELYKLENSIKELEGDI